MTRPIDRLFPDRFKAVTERRCINPPIGCGKPLKPLPDHTEEVPSYFTSYEQALEYQMTAMCPVCQDNYYNKENEEVTTVENREHPMPGQVLMNVNHLQGDYDNNDPEERTVTSELEKATVVTSMVEQKLGRGVHKPVLDIDIPVKVVPSTTEGHNHLYIDKEMSWEQYQKLMEVLVEVGILERGYVGASKERGHTAVRMPWIKKDAAYDVRESHTQDPWNRPLPVF